MKGSLLSKFNIPDSLTVDWLLNNVDLTFKSYIPSATAFEFFSFMRLVLGEEPENSNPLAHYFLIDTIFKQDNVKFYYEERGIDYEELAGRTAIMCAREFSKSTLIGSFLPLFMAWKGEIPGYGKVNYGLYVADSMRNNVKTTMETIETVFLESEWLQDQFESYKFTDEVIQLTRHPRTPQEIATYNKAMELGKKKVEVPKRSKRTFTMKGVGAQTGTRGTRTGLQRPQFVIFDDLVSSEKDASSEVILENIETTIDSDVLKALHGSGSFAMLIGTPFNKNDPVYKRIENGGWLPVVFPIAKEVRSDMTINEFEGVWEDRHSYKAVMKRWAEAVRDNKTRSFNQELMLRITSEEDKMIPESYFTWIRRSDILKFGNEYNWYITTDFTTSGKRGNDFSGIAVWAVNSNDDRILVDLSLKKLDLAEQYNELFRFVNKYKRFTGTVEVGIETDGQQKAHIFSVKQMMASKNEYFTIAKQKGTSNEGIRSGKERGSKHDRFKAGAVPLFQNGKIWFVDELKNSADMQELITELSYVTYAGFGSQHDDGADLITQLSMMNIYAPSEITHLERNANTTYDPMWAEEDDHGESYSINSYVI